MLTRIALYAGVTPQLLNSLTFFRLALFELLGDLQICCAQRFFSE